MYYVYFLKSRKKAPWVYIGFTNNLKRRLSEHISGRSKYTKVYLPIYLDSYIAVKSESKARELEAYFKTGSGNAILKKRILNNSLKGQLS